MTKIKVLLDGLVFYGEVEEENDVVRDTLSDGINEHTSFEINLEEGKVLILRKAAFDRAAFIISA